MEGLGAKEGKEMAEKDGTTELAARTATDEASEDEQPKRSPQPMNHNKQYLANSKSDRERTSGSHQMSDSQRLSYLQNIPRGMLDRSLQAQLGRQLRAIFSDVAQEPVPDRFVKLLEALEAREKRR